jgi:PAS domain S-box-containing protein
MAKLIIKIENADEQFRLLFSNSTDPHFVLSGTGVIIDCNDAAMDILEADSRADLNGRKISDLAPHQQANGEESIDRINKMWAKAQKNGSERFDISMKSFKGEELPLEITLTSVTRSKKKLMLSVWHDLRERNKAELEVRKSEQRLNTAQRIAKLGNWQLEVATGKLWWSQEVFEQCGLEPQKDPPEFKKYIEFLHPEDLNKFVDIIEKAIDTGNGFDFEYRVILPDGKIRHIHAIGKNSMDENGKTVSITGTSQDITERKEAEMEIKKAKDKLESLNAELQEMNKQLEENIKKSNNLAMEAEQASKAKSEFLANVSHEIRTPLNAILGFSEIMEGLTTDPQQQEYLSSIKNSGKSLLTLINDILDLSKVEAGKLTLEYSAFNPAGAINEISQIFANKIEEKGLSLEINIAQDLPGGIILDETRFRQIMLNLLSNAVKFTEKGSIKISARPENISKTRFDFVFSVEDTGIGIPEDQVDKIFGAFEQRDGQSHARFGGTGLGLTITERLALIMNGDISVKSKLDKGSKFKVKLRDVEIAELDAQLSESASFKAAKVVFDNAIILLLSSEKESRDIFKGYLNIYPELECLETKNIEEAMEKISDKRPNVILVDVKTRDGGELEFLRKLKDNDDWKTIPAIAATASVKKESEEELRKLSEGFLRKPVTRKEFIFELMKHIKHSIGDEENIITPRKPLMTRELKEPLGLLKSLEIELRENYQNLQDEMMMNKIEEFGTRLKMIADAHNADFLEEYASELLAMVNSFDIVKLPETMKRYPEIVAKIKEALKKEVDS